MFMFAFLLVGGVSLALSGAFEDEDVEQSDTVQEEAPLDEGFIRVTEPGAQPEDIAPEEVSLTEWSLHFAEDSFLSEETVAEVSGYDGGDEDTLIETNRDDDIYQVIDAGGGVDVVEIGPGDFADLRLENEETGDDIDGEGGDTLVVHLSEADLAGAATIEAVAGGYIDIDDIDDIPDTTPLFEAELGAEDRLDIALPEGVVGAVEVLEGVETHMYGTTTTGAGEQAHEGLVFFVPEGMSLPDDLRYDEGTLWAGSDFGGVEAWDVEGILLLGRIDLGVVVSAGYSGYSDAESPDEDAPRPQNYTYGHDRMVDVPILSLNGVAA